MIIQLSEVRARKSEEKYNPKAIDSNEDFIPSEEKNPIQFIPSEAFNKISKIQGYNYLKKGLLISKHISSLDDILTSVMWSLAEFNIEKETVYRTVKETKKKLLEEDAGLPFDYAQIHCEVSGGFMMSFPEYICTLRWLKSNRDEKSNQDLEDSLTIEGVEWLDSIISIEKPNRSLLKLFPSYSMISHPEDYKSIQGFGIKMDVKIKTEKDSREYSYINEISVGKLNVTNSLFTNGACNYFNHDYELSVICRGSYENHSFGGRRHTMIQNIPADTTKYQPRFTEVQKPSVRVCYKIK